MFITAFFANAGVPALGLSPTVRVRDLSTNALVVTDAAMTEVGEGVYKYAFAGYNPALEYSIVADGTATLADADRYVVGGNENYLPDIEGSAVLAKEATVAAIPTTTLTTTENTQLMALNTANLDVAVSTRATQVSVDGTPAAIDASTVLAKEATVAAIPTTTLTAAENTQLMALDTTNLDAAVSSRATQASVDALPTAATNATAVWANTTGATVASNSATASDAAATATAVWSDATGTAVATKVDETHKIHGLDIANPLTVDDAASLRYAGAAVNQTVVTTGNKTVVTRQ